MNDVGQGLTKALALEGRGTEPTIPAALVADAVLYLAGLPLEVNVLTLAVMATGMPLLGRG